MSTRIAYLGPQGTFTEAALWQFVSQGGIQARKHVDGICVLDDADGGAGRDAAAIVVPVPVTSPQEAIDAVRNGRADYACVAIENSVDGPVTPTFDALASGFLAPESQGAAPGGASEAHGGVQIYAELDLEIRFAIMVRPGTTYAQCRTISTHPVAYQQVKGWLAQHIPEHEFVPASSNAAAAGLVAQGQVDIAAAPAPAAYLHGLEILADQIADNAQARTRFVLVGPTGTVPPRTGHDRTAVVFTLKNEPGSLVTALTEFAVRGVDLSRIESRPIQQGLGTYRFHVDLHGHIHDALVAEALQALYVRCENMTFLGSWPAGSHDVVPPSGVDHKRYQRAQEWVSFHQGTHPIA
ncbi:prephenate dehydratase [Corynebacterium sp. HS2168-gen11]|uniref:prephenate dehydratase n=1 Tax=Corynebacterium sp. HS2168-gen11 TaxID=2974027 RepID=UPI00216B478C|nr:prephenate dehydratase [Corynebacterium sp. HS2168-gen11]MCS4535954.1 prephenate dehydratase [Corynebacterium sp. HS2168-gen11]